MKTYTAEQISSLIQQFENRTLKKEAWTHEAHLIVAIWYSSKNSFKKTLQLVRNHIKAFNLATGTENTDTGGYHETITHFWLSVAHQFIKKNPEKSVTELCNLFIKSKMAFNDFFFNFYSKELLFSTKARREFVEPDIKEINI